MKDGVLRLGRFEPASAALGPGLRSGVWVQGCRRRCRGCTSPELLSSGGSADEVTITELFARIQTAQRQRGTEGVTFSGGEPFEQAGAVASLARRLRASGLSVIAWSGRTIEELRSSGDSGVRRLLGELDVLIDGPYIERLKCDDQPMRGSSNQRIIFLSGRYRREDFLEQIVEMRHEDERISSVGVADPRAINAVFRMFGIA
jgi:anaerobic ribonucleoside-triphosphate reductase activating protein